MPAIGSTVNPALGRVDYSPYLQGAMQGNQAMLQGAQAMGNAYAGIGQSIGQGIQKYLAEQEKTKAQLGQITAIIKSNPKLAEQNIDPKVLESVMNGKIKPKDVTEVYANLSLAQKLEQDALEQRLRQLQISEIERKRDEEKRVASMLPILLKPMSPAEEALRSGAKFEDLGNMGKDAFVAQPPNAEKFLQRGFAASIPVNILAPIARELTNAEKMKAAAAAGPTPTSAMRDTEAIIASEINSGALDGKDANKVEARRAELLSQGGRDAQEKFYNAGTFVRRTDQGGAVAAVRDSKSGMIGVVGRNGKFEPLDMAVYQPIGQSDINAFMDAKQFKDFSDKLVQEENSVRQLSKYIEGAGDLPTGIDKASARLSALIKTSVTKEPLTKEEQALGISTARQQGLLGALRTTILGPGVLTEIDAKRILDRLGGRIESVFTNPEIVKAAMSEVLSDKMAEYEKDLQLYNAHVAGRYGQSGYSQRNAVFTNKAASKNVNYPISPVLAESIDAELKKRSATKK